jgi:4-hydroxy-tetrahydrodipicolinate reductase
VSEAGAIRTTRVGLVGLGPIGVEIGKALAARSDVKLTAAADPQLAEAPLRKLVPKAPKSVVVDRDLPEAIARGVDVVVIATSSRWKQVVPLVDTAIAARVHVVSTCEELAAPGVDAVGWARLAARAEEAGVTVLGTGVNPGFVMDRLVLQLAGACVRVDKVSVERVVDAAQRRAPLRKKVGEGLTAAEFKAGVAAGMIGHVGLRQSAQLIATGLGWKLERYREKIDPVLGSDGKCLGINQIARGDVDGSERITLRLQMSVGAAGPFDAVHLDGDPPIELRIAGGTHGDRGTVGTVVNAVLRVAHARRGLVTVADLFC